ncbi:MAG: family 43 glycosylhydrolase [Lachnospiraceae bacterium]|nr:family 43 glycosylhydrolase [Lachnospiraceae bacterium]
MQQIFNPFLPLNEYIPDGEPHVFDGRVYIYGSHDREGGYTFCMDDYVTYSADINDLKNWRYEGVIFKASQDPDYPQKKYMYAPDVVRGNDGKYYLYYCMSGDYGVGGYTGSIHVAVSDSPKGPFTFLGEVKYPDGRTMMDYVCFDPAAINDDGEIRLYYGTQYDFEEREDFTLESRYVTSEMDMFGRTKEDILSYLDKPESCKDEHCQNQADSIMGTVMLTLEDDMLTVKEAPHHIIPYRTKGTSFEAHPFFEASSMRKVGNTYYFVYSSMQNHELCYATSKFPDRGFTFGGTIVSNGDIGFEGRKEKDKHNMTGTTHGSIIQIGEKWYVFYHRLTHKSDYSRQACAQEITIAKDGSIAQVEITSCGLNGGPLMAKGYTYPAPISCILSNGHMPHGCNSIYKESFPNVNHLQNERFIAEICDGTLIGYKYFDMQNVSGLRLTWRLETEKNKPVYDGPERKDERTTPIVTESFENAPETGYFTIALSENGDSIGTITLSDCEDWTESTASLPIPDGVHALFLTYHGKHRVQLKEFAFL